MLTFWDWFFKGSGGKRGFRAIINIWLFFHIIIGILLSIIVNIPLNEAANTVLLPLAGIFIGLSFAWAANAQALMQSTEIRELAANHPGGYFHYLYTFQTAIFVIIITLIFWGLAGLSIFENLHCNPNQRIIYFLVKTILFTFASLTLRECWHVILGVQMLLLIQNQIDQTKKK